MKFFLLTSVQDTPWSSLTFLLRAESDADDGEKSGGRVSTTGARGLGLAGVEISEDDEETEDDEIFLLLASEQTSGLTLLLLFWPELVRAVELASGRNEAVLDGRLTTERTKYKTP